ncbi:MAG: FMN-binding negative transcriptional regulator [Rouxiella aceris]|uniref:FMN-binding negative transcriptional regulator n=1 Tax=Rouxiella aceris TaxID=2703884 RepID=UPI00283C40C8|nr:FMN-binding negative transcriptional regulator [Rouxiella aceris]MDR3430937.1 FMN-binding negative transcriptional regulator [Rouxiella aceris]
MYVPPPFRENRTEVLYDLIAHYPLGTLVSQTDGQLDAMHLPFEINLADNGTATLLAHVARANPIWREVANGSDVLIVFRGGDAYISPNWYPSKQQTHRQVPTWNYRAVHVRGQITFRDDLPFLHDVLTRLTARQEATQTLPWQIGDAPEDYIAGMLKAIVGVEITISEIVGCVKLGQNKNQQDLQGAANGVIEQGNLIIGGAMLAGLKDKN